MTKKQVVKIITPNFDKIINIKPFLEKEFLKRGYKKYRNNFLMKIFYNIYIIRLRKVRVFYRLLKKINFKFKKNKQKNLLIFDCEGSSGLEKLLANLDFDIVSTRVEKITEVFISNEIVKFMFKNYFRRSIKENYLIAFIKSASPKLVITNNDNSPEFHNISKALEDTKIKFIAVQCANRGDTVWKDSAQSKKIYIPEFLCFSDFDRYIHQWKKCNIKKYTSIGSLQASFAKDYIKSKNFLNNSENFDICLVSEFKPDLDGDWAHIEDIQDKFGQLAEYVYRLGKECELKIIFTGKSSKEDREAEFIFYKKYIKNFDFQISPFDQSKYSGYVNLIKSKLVIGFKSTILREAFLFKKKVLACNLTGHKDIIFPSDGICNLNKDTTYEDFKTRVLLILKMSDEEYIKQMTKDKNYIMNTEINTQEFIKNRVNEILQL